MEVRRVLAREARNGQIKIQNDKTLVYLPKFPNVWRIPFNIRRMGSLFMAKIVPPDGFLFASSKSYYSRVNKNCHAGHGRVPRAKAWRSTVAEAQSPHCPFCQPKQSFGTKRQRSLRSLLHSAHSSARFAALKRVALYRHDSPPNTHEKRK
jgi:hypothetical protein